MLIQERNLSKLCVAMAFIWAAHFFVDLMLGIWPVYKSLVEMNLAKAGLIAAIGAFIGEGSQLVFGFLSDRGYRKPIIIIGLMIAAASAFLAYFKSNEALFGLYTLTCVGSGAFHPSAAGLMNTLMPERRGLLIAIFSSGGSVGLALSQLIFTHIYDFFPGETYLLALPAMFIAIFMIFYAFPQTNTPSAHNMNFKDIFSFFKRKDLRALYIASVAQQSIMWGTIFILPDVLKAFGHTDWICFGGGHMCLILGGAVMVIPAGYLADKYSDRSVMLAVSLIALISFYTLIFFGSMSVTFVLPVLFILGAVLNIFLPIAISLGGRLVPEQPSTVSAFLMGLVWCVSEAIGPGGIGLTATLFPGDYAPVKALALLGSLFLVNIYAVLALPKKALFEPILDKAES